ncbi:MAG: HIT domain-containing protein [Alphaproteobacteria bacterium]
MENDFVLNETLKNDTFLVGDLKLCRVLLMNRKEIPWFILVPRRNNIKETFELSPDDTEQLFKEINSFAKELNSIFEPDKVNIAALGNVVPQLHIHIIARYKTDSAWPSPVFGKLLETFYDDDSKNKIIDNVQRNILPKIE